MNDIALIVPGTTAFDKDGCEDPTLIIHRSEYLIYYSGWNQTTTPTGPWKIIGEFLPSQPDSWDSYHLSSGPIVSLEQSRNLMF